MILIRNIQASRLGTILLVLLLTLLSNLVLAENKLDRLDAYLSKSEVNGFSGAVLVAQNGQIILQKGYGLADQEAKQMITAKTVFDIGSLTKQFTGAAILKLVEQHKLALADPLSKFFPDLPEDKRAITLHQLLTHTSGLQELPDMDDFDLVPTEEFFQRMFSLPLLYKPGLGYEYTNSGYSVLARIIELVTHASYEQFLHDELFVPAGMMQTGYLLPDWRALPIAKGYRLAVIPEGTMVARYQSAGDVSWVLKGNGGIQSTLGDMYLWIRTLESNKVLSATSKALLTSRHVAEDAEKSSYYGYGWTIFNSSRNTTIVAHNGSNRIFFADLLWLEEEQSLIILLNNTAVDGIYNMAWRLEKMLFNSDYQPPAFELPAETRVIPFIRRYDGAPQDFSKALFSKFSFLRDSPDVLNSIGNGFLGDNIDVKRGVMVLKANAELHPEEGNCWDSLGEAYYRDGQYELAKKAFNKALSMGGKQDCLWCENSKAFLDRIAKEVD